MVAPGSPTPSRGFCEKIQAEGVRFSGEKTGQKLDTRLLYMLL